METEKHALFERPNEARRRESEGAALRQHDHFVPGKMPRQDRADAVAQRIAARQHDDTLSLGRRDLLHGGGERLQPHQTFGRTRWDMSEMALAADQQLRRLDERTPRWRQAIDAVLADADEGKPCAHARASGAASALTAAAASALPPRRPASVTKGSPHGFSASAALASAAPTKPTGNPSTSAGRGAPAAIISRRWNSAVGALPMATTAPASIGRHNSTAVAERVVARRRASPATRRSSSVQMTPFFAGNRARAMPAATIPAS